jgi:8-oxo-dGTP pyrophosphatase MutT (NUDIX family)
MASDENREPATLWRILDSHNAFEHRWYVLRRDTVELPDGGVIDDYFVSVRPEVVVVVPIDRTGSFIMVRQYQHGAGQITLEFPAGTFRNEAPADAALRELEEETGYIPGRIEPLGACFENASKNTNRNHLFLAEDCDPRGTQKLERTEQAAGLTVQILTPVELAHALDTGQIVAMSSLVAGYRALRRLAEKAA